jgi:SpoIID/LytB domain protein
VEQHIAHRFVHFLQLALALPDFVVFYNGPKCGASAPDHAHFQAGSKGLLPIESGWRDLVGETVAEQGEACLLHLNDAPRSTYVIDSPNQKDAVELFRKVYEALKTLQPAEKEPMMNLLGWREEGHYIVCVFPRAKHRPDCYFAEGEGRLLISPASVDLGGLFITPREEDFEKVRAEDLARILEEVTASPLAPLQRRGELHKPSQRPGYQTADTLKYTLLKEKQKTLKKEPTDAEAFLWEHLRNNQLGYKFRRQHIIDSYIADFVCLEKKLIVEVDGGYHGDTGQKIKDKERSECLNSIGFQVLRFNNEEVLMQPKTVIDQIEEKLEATPSPLERGIGGEAPVVHVGIMFEPEIGFELLSGQWTVGSGQCLVDRGQYSCRYEDGKIAWNGQLYDELRFEPEAPSTSVFELRDVTIGINFHWEKKENQRFQGALKFIVENGKLTAINVLPVEDYLVSVMSSEMSAHASLELLKAHAVISRSWLLSNLKPHPQPLSKGEGSRITPPPFGGGGREERLVWYERDAHLNFDVCADDHCQRYQGITRASTALVRQAVAATRGEVLSAEGEICDARFSKCCGGVFEEFQYCWADEQKPYLARQRDSKTHTELPDLTREEEAERWIRSSPEAFCNTDDEEVLKQVLNDYDYATKDFYRWQVSYTQEELSALVRERSGVDYGLITDLVPVARGTSGRLWQLKIVGTKETRVIGKELEIRRTLSKSHLYSSAFVVDKEYQTENGETKLRFVLTGAGWGHGVGLCQIGAAVMGAKGYSYDEILLHYFHGASLERLYE